MQHIIWLMFKIPFLIIMFFIGLVIWIAAGYGIYRLIVWVRSDPFKEPSPEEKAQEENKRRFFGDEKN